MAQECSNPLHKASWCLHITSTHLSIPLNPSWWFIMANKSQMPCKQLLRLISQGILSREKASMSSVLTRMVLRVVCFFFYFQRLVCWMLRWGAVDTGQLWVFVMHQGAVRFIKVLPLNQHPQHPANAELQGGPHILQPVSPPAYAGMAHVVLRVKGRNNQE